MAKRVADLLVGVLFEAGVQRVYGVSGLGTTAFHGHQKITLCSGREMLIWITGR